MILFPLVVSGIVKDIDQNTDFTFSTFISRATLENTNLKPEDWTQWDNTNSASQLLVKLSPGTDPKKIEAGMDGLYIKNHKPDPEDHSKSSFKLQPLSDLHFNSDYGGYDLPLASKPTLYSLLAVALFLLVARLYQFYKSNYSPCGSKSKRNWHSKNFGKF